MTHALTHVQVDQHDAPPELLPNALPGSTLALPAILDSAFRSSYLNGLQLNAQPQTRDWLATNSSRMDRYQLQSFLRMLRRPTVPTLPALIARDFKENKTVCSFFH